MLKRKHIFLLVVIGTSILFLTGCGSGSTVCQMKIFNISDAHGVENNVTKVEEDSDQQESEADHK